jgi:hypothetical protein
MRALTPSTKARTSAESSLRERLSFLIARADSRREGSSAWGRAHTAAWSFEDRASSILGPRKAASY